jgi:hypothetical protein
MVGGFPIPEVNRLMHAFMAGVRETAPDTSSRWPSSARGSIRPRPRNRIRADRCRRRHSVRGALRRVRRGQGKGILAIGNVIDTQADYPDTVVASAIWHFEPTLDMAIAMVKAGTFKADNYGVYSFMKEGGCSLAPLGTFEGKVPEAAIEARGRAGSRDQGRRSSWSRSTTKSPSPADEREARPEAAETVLRLSGITKRFGRWSPMTRSRFAEARRGGGAARRKRRRQDDA